jgi:hypothetical protein
MVLVMSYGGFMIVSFDTIKSNVFYIGKQFFKMGKMT